MASYTKRSNMTNVEYPHHVGEVPDMGCVTKEYIYFGVAVRAPTWALAWGPA